MKISDKAGVVTGATGGIGLAATQKRLEKNRVSRPESSIRDLLTHLWLKVSIPKSKIGLGRKIQLGETARIICAMIENPVLTGEVQADASMTPLA